MKKNYMMLHSVKLTMIKNEVLKKMRFHIKSILNFHKLMI